MTLLSLCLLQTQPHHSTYRNRVQKKMSQMTSTRKLWLDFKSLQITNKLKNCSKLSLLLPHNSLLNLKLFHMPLQFTFLREEFCTDYANVNWYSSSLTVAYSEQENRWTSQSQLNHRVQHHTKYEYHMFHHPTQS